MVTPSRRTTVSTFHEPGEIMKQLETKRPALSRPTVARVLGRAAVAGGVVLAGAAFGVLLSLPTGGTARAGDSNYVRSSSHEAISNVRLDEEISILFNAPLWAPSVGPDTVLIRTGPTQGEQANGRYVVGRFLYDRNTQRRVVIRPEAVQEYYQLARGYSREDASRLAEQTIRRIEQTGGVRQLDKIDRGLVQFFSASYGAGTRLDDESVFANYPPVLNPDDPIGAYRERIAGDDALWQDYFVNANFNAYAELQQNPEYERFYHRVDPATGIADDESILRRRQYRRVLLDRRSTKRVTFVPNVPIRADLSDTGYKTASAYSIVIPTVQPGSFNSVLTKSGHRPLSQAGGRDYSTYFTTMPGSASTVGLFLDNESRTGLATLQKPRIVNITPPNGETFVDPTTDWEDPDSTLIPVTARRTFTIRMRFAQPIDPRSVSPSNFTVRKIKNNPGQPTEQPVDIPIAVGTFLNQHRLGIVEVEITPATNLDGNGQYEVAAKGLVKSLGGELLNTDYKVSFITGASAPPLDAIRENFLTVTNQANPLNPDTLGQYSTAWWSAPVLYDPDLTGKSMPKYMPFAGTGVGAPENPLDAAGSPIVTELDLQAGESITFVTENLDPASPTFGGQVEYNYRNISMSFATAQTRGRYPLVLRSQLDIALTATKIFVNGLPGGVGKMNSDTVGGDPTGGIGGGAGPGGYRGGDGGGAPLTDLNGVAIPDGQGRLQFDQTKLAGSDGLPGYLLANGSPGGGGSGGFSGDREAPVLANYDGLNGIDPEDNALEPARYREAGGGGGHATVGGNGDGSRGSRETHPGGYDGGLGGLAYGDGAFSTAPLNALSVPTLGLGFGGAGGAGGGREDDAPLGTDGPEDAGGGGGGGGGGAVQLTARRNIVLDGTTIDARGGKGGRTYNEIQSAEGQGAPGGSGAGGSIWLQAYEGNVTVTNGSQLLAEGGVNTDSVGQITTSKNDTIANPDPIKGKGGAGGLGFIRLEDSDGAFPNLTGQTVGDLYTGVFAPEADGSYPGRDDVAFMVVNQSIVYSGWFNTQLDTPTFQALYDDPLTPAIEGTKLEEYAVQSGGEILIQVRAAPNDVANTGHPNLFQATNWVPLDMASTISDRRFLQFRITYTLPFNYLFSQPLPYVDYLQINIELR
jgi:hypothetical protein